MMPLTLSVLDQSPICEGARADRAFAESLALAQKCEALGYHRDWLAEHHGSNSFAGASSEVLIAHIASATSRIRIGSGGVMLMHYSPLKVAENFRVLETLYPGRIDLGIGRAPGSDGLTASALAYGRNQVLEPADNLGSARAQVSRCAEPARRRIRHTSRVGDTADGHLWARPVGGRGPELWVLGSSFESGLLAAELGMPYSFAHFINAPETEKSLEIYRARFKPSGLIDAPRANLGVFVICAETGEEARALARCRDLWRVRFEAGEFRPMPSIEEAAAYEFSEAELAGIDRTSAHRVQGTPNEVYDQLTSLAKRFAVEEIVVLSVTPTYRQRMRCYGLLADAFDLKGQGEAAAQASSEEVTL